MGKRNEEIVEASTILRIKEIQLNTYNNFALNKDQILHNSRMFQILQDINNILCSYTTRNL